MIYQVPLDQDFLSPREELSQLDQLKKKPMSAVNQNTENSDEMKKQNFKARCVSAHVK